MSSNAIQPGAPLPRMRARRPGRLFAHAAHAGGPLTPAPAPAPSVPSGLRSRHPAASAVRIMRFIRTACCKRCCGVIARKIAT